MILDSSTVVAILCREPDYATLIEKMTAAEVVAIGALSAFETAMALTIKLRKDGLAVLNDFLQESGVLTAPFTQEHASCAFGAYLRYGKGRHPAALNFGDCLSYAMSKISKQPLLYVGKGFARTDVATA